MIGGNSGLLSPWTTRIISPSPVPQNMNRNTNAAVNDTNRIMFDLHPLDVIRRSGSGTNLKDIADIQLFASTDISIQQPTVTLVFPPELIQDLDYFEQRVRRL